MANKIEKWYPGEGKLTTGWAIIYVILVLGFVSAMARLFLGLGATTNLSDGYPWGLWISFDILAGRGPGRRRLHHGRGHLYLQPEEVRAPAPARQALGLPRVHDVRGRALLRPGPALAHLAPHGDVEPPLGAL